MSQAQVLKGSDSLFLEGRPSVELHDASSLALEQGIAWPVFFTAEALAALRDSRSEAHSRAQASSVLLDALLAVLSARKAKTKTTSLVFETLLAQTFPVERAELRQFRVSLVVTEGDKPELLLDVEPLSAQVVS